MPSPLSRTQGRPGQPSRQTQTRKSGVVQPKMMVASQVRQPPAAPPVYRPQPVPKVLQTKMPVSHPTVNHSKQTPAPPPVYRPHPVPHVLQRKTVTGGQPPQAVKSPRQPVAPPVDRPEPKKILQPKMIAAAQAPKRPTPPPVYRQPLTSKVLQAKSAKTSVPHAGHYTPTMPQRQLLPPHALRCNSVVQRMENPKDTLSDEVAPFVSESYRSAISGTDITKHHKGTYVYQVTKCRNLPGIRESGLVPRHGGSRIGLSQNPSQKESLYARSMANSKGRVTVATASVTVDNYKKKGVEWHSQLNENLTAMAHSTNGQTLWEARAKLKSMRWIDDSRLDTLLEHPLEGNENPEVRTAFVELLAVNKLNAPVTLRSRSNAAKWTVDPDDPMGYQTTQPLSANIVELLHGNEWINIRDGRLDTLMSEIEVALSEESHALAASRVPARRERRRLGLFGVDSPKVSVSELADMMGL